MKRLIIAVNEETCIGCGRCVESCPTKALELKDGKVKLKDESLCDGFGSCIAVCPTHSLYLEEREAKPFDWSVLRRIDFNEFLDKLVKHYRPKELVRD